MHKDSLLEIIQIYTGVLEVHYHSKDSNIFFSICQAVQYQVEIVHKNIYL